MRSSEMTARTFDFLTQAADGNIDLYDSIQYYCDKTIEEGIFSFSSDYNADVIAIPTHGRRGLAHFFAGSIGEELVNHSDIPVLTFKI